jgi:hypothetical protein
MKFRRPWGIAGMKRWDVHGQTEAVTLPELL